MMHILAAVLIFLPGGAAKVGLPDSRCTSKKRKTTGLIS